MNDFYEQYPFPEGKRYLTKEQVIGMFTDSDAINLECWLLYENFPQPIVLPEDIEVWRKTDVDEWAKQSITP